MTGSGKHYVDIYLHEKSTRQNHAFPSSILGDTVVHVVGHIGSGTGGDSTSGKETRRER